MNDDKKDVKEVENLRSGLLALRNQIPGALKTWKSRKPVCDYYAPLIKEMCLNPNLVEGKILDPLVKWLSDYQLIREGISNMPKGKDLDNFILMGLNNIYNFIYFSEFLSKNTDFFTQDVKGQKEYEKILNEISSKLIGCDNRLSFLFLRLSKTVKNLNDNMKQIQNYLENRCLGIRVQNLKP